MVPTAAGAAASSPLPIPFSSVFAPWLTRCNVVGNRGYIPSGDDDDLDYDQVAQHASRSAGGSGQADFFSSIIGNFVGKKSQLAHEDIDEQGT